MHEVAPKIRPAAVERPLYGAISSVRIRAQLDLMDKDGTIIDIRTAQGAPARVDHMQRFAWTTGSRLAEGSSGLVRTDILVMGSTPQLITQKWEVSATDVQWTDALYPLRRRPCVAVITCPTGTRSTAAGITVHAGDAASRILEEWWNPE